MSKRILAAILSAFMLLSVFAGCADNKENISSIDSSSTIEIQSETDKSDKNDKDTESKNNSSGNKSQSTTTTSKPTGLIRDEEDEDEELGWGDDTSSQTTSSSIKTYANSVKIGIYHLAMRWCDTYGEDFDSRAREFEEMVEAQYFNTYFLHAQDFSKGYLMKEIEIIAKNGGTFWLTLWNHHTHKETIQSHEAALKKIIDAITEAGYRDRLIGMTWDEPIWNGQANSDFLKQSELYYKKFGLRTFPVFATGEFSGSEGNLSTPAEKFGKIATEAMKYVTDVAFDSYGVDVRDSASNGNQSTQYAAWSKELGINVKNGRDYYTGYKELLKKRIGHNVNFWYFPTAFEWNTWNGGKADEQFCMAHLKFMADDVLNETFTGGIVLYTYYQFKTSHNTVAFGQHCDVVNKQTGTYRYPDIIKWEKYCDLVRETCQRFNATEARTVYLGV